ncbi:MAG: hypothetical protein FWH27_15165, partial [Planctomycetaceae bacterium]|nr:hypothetical protein [Planctomycetaceae bacterium]
QIIDQETTSLKHAQASYDEGNPRTPLLKLIEAKQGVTRAKIDFSTFLLNETALTPDEYVQERLNLRSLYEELRDLAKEEVQAGKEMYEVGRMTLDELFQFERKLSEAEIALIRLFPEKESAIPAPTTPVIQAPEAKPPTTPPGLSEVRENRPEDDENLTIEQKYAVASLRVAKSQLERALQMMERTPGTITEKELDELKAKVMEAEMRQLTAEPGHLESTESQEKIRAYCEQLRDLDKKNLERAIQLHQEGFIPLDDVNAAKMKLIRTEMQLLVYSPDIDYDAKHQQVIDYHAQFVDILENAFLVTYAKYQAGMADGTIANLAKARCALLQYRYILHLSQVQSLSSEAERVEVAAQSHTLLREMYLAAAIHARAVYEMVEVGRMPKDEEKHALRILEQAKEMLKGDPSINPEAISTDNVDVSDWYYELRPEEKPTGVLVLPKPPTTPPEVRENRPESNWMN